jgi:hypothetical protein
MNITIIEKLNAKLTDYVQQQPDGLTQMERDKLIFLLHERDMEYLLTLTLMWRRINEDGKSHPSFFGVNVKMADRIEKGEPLLCMEV